MLIKLPLNAFSAISWHQIDARYPSHYGKMELLRHLKWSMAQSRKVFCSVRGAAPAALRAAAGPKLQQNRQTLDRLQKGSQSLG